MRRSLKFRAALATGLVVAVVIFALAVVAQYYAYLSLRDLLQSQQDTLVKLVAEQLDEKFEGRAIVLRRLARQLAPMLDRGPDELRAFATQAVSIPEAFNAVSLIWPDGELAFNSATPLGQHISLAVCVSTRFDGCASTVIDGRLRHRPSPMLRAVGQR